MPKLVLVHPTGQEDWAVHGGPGEGQCGAGSENRGSSPCRVTPPVLALTVDFSCPKHGAKQQGPGIVVGQWVRYPIKVHLKGGYRPATEPEVQTVPLSLEAFIYV
jgi:hypothetical protein